MSACSLCFVAVPIGSRCCFKCRVRLVAEVRWEGCARCGKRNCRGSCGCLRALSELRCAFKYAGLPARLVVAAKLHGSREARRLLEDCFVRRATEALVWRLQENPPGEVVLAPLAARRWLSREWHPLESVQLGLIEATRSGRIPQGIRIRWESDWRWRRQSARSGALRREGLSLRGGDSGWTLPDPRLPSVLLVDDVLTSGETLLRSARREGEGGAPVEAFVLFRTCVSVETGSDSG